MSYARSLNEVGVGGPGSKLGNSSSTCSSSTYLFEGDLGEASIIFGGWTKKSIRGSRATIEGIRASSGKRLKTEEEVREAPK